MADTEKTSEVHLILIWNNGLEKQAAIIEDLKENFQILLSATITWPESSFAEKLVGFYNNEAIIKFLDGKIERIGNGPFTVLLIVDSDPTYEQRDTTHGTDLVNINLFDRKQRYRSWIGHNALHASDNQSEALNDLAYLREDILQSAEEPDRIKALLNSITQR